MDEAMLEIMTTKDIAEYLKLHEITICKYATDGKIPGIRIGRVWRFDKDVIDKWITTGESIPVVGKGAKRKATRRSCQFQSFR
jgi:excisionase family DNA binding protein